MQRRFLVLCLVVIALLALQARHQPWTGDFWEHSAIVRELMTHLAHPEHPRLLLSASHPLNTPYSVAVALFARAFHLDSVTALAFAGIVNLCLLLLGLRLFVESMVPHDGWGVAFYTLLLTLLGWGQTAWGYSGVFHIGSLSMVYPYPSTFATAVALLALGVNHY